MISIVKIVNHYHLKLCTKENNESLSVILIIRHLNSVLQGVQRGKGF